MKAKLCKFLLYVKSAKLTCKFQYPKKKNDWKKKEKEWFLSMLQWVPNSPPSDIEQASKYSNGSLFYIYLPRNGSLMEVCVFCNCKKNLIGTLWVLDKRKWYLHFGRVVQLNWLLPEWANTRAHWCPNGITIVRYLLSTMLCCPLSFLEHFLRSVCCSGIGLGGALCVLMSGTLRAIDWRSGPTFSRGLSERHIGVSCASSPDETLTWDKNHVKEFLITKKKK